MHFKNDDYERREYLSSAEVSRYLGISVRRLHELISLNILHAFRASSGQYRFSFSEVSRVKKSIFPSGSVPGVFCHDTSIDINGTDQRVLLGNAQRMSEIENDSVHLIITSPPYLDAKMYTSREKVGNLGDIHDFECWMVEISKVWKECFRVLQPGRKAFVNVMNLPVRGKEGFRSINIAGRTIDAMEKLGFTFRREIIWQKTNSVRAHFGTYPYPGNILLNFSHEFILEFEKPAPRNIRKYAHLSREQKEASRIEKEFWLAIKRSDVWLMAPEGSGDRRTHPSPFPYELPYRLIRAYSYRGERVLDPFLGSGTTLMAAADLGRNGIGYEIVEEIAYEAVKRIRLHSDGVDREGRRSALRNERYLAAPKRTQKTVK